MTDTAATFAEADAPEIDAEIDRLYTEISNVNGTAQQNGRRDVLIHSLKGALTFVRTDKVARAGKVVDNVRSQLWAVGL